MGMLEWPQVFAAASGKSWTYGLGDLWGGKFSVEIGQSLSGYLVCGRQTHILGQELKLVVDPESLLAPSSGIGMLAAGLLLGASGKSEFYIGRNMGMTYIGPKFDINRSMRGRTLAAGALHKEVGFANHNKDLLVNDPQLAVDKAAAIACGLMAAITSGVAIGLDIAAKIQYGDGKSPTALFSVLNSLSLALTPRLMAIMEIIEFKCGWVNVGSAMLKTGLFIAHVVAGVLLAAIIMVPIVGWAIGVGIVTSESASTAVMAALGLS